MLGIQSIQIVIESRMIIHLFTRDAILCSFQFETEAEGTKLRRDVFAEGKAGVGPSAKGLVSMLSGQEEMFAFRRAVSNQYISFSMYYTLLLA
jgi:hypothetical protein